MYRSCLSFKVVTFGVSRQKSEVLVGALFKIGCVERRCQQNPGWKSGFIQNP
jgi:hypothetical protein